MAHPSHWQDPLEQISETSSLPVDRFLTFRVNQLSTAFERQWSRFMREQAGVNLSEWRVLAVLQEGPLTFARVAEATGVDKALMSRSIRQLTSMDLLKVSDTPDDARSITLTLSASGHKLLAKVLPLALARQRHFLSVLSPTERRVLYSAIEKLKVAATEWDSVSESPAHK